MILIFGLYHLGFASDIMVYREVNVESLYLRAGPNKNFEILKKLKKGDVLEFVEKKYGWTRVVLPSDTPLYVYREMVAISGNRAIVVKNRVNVRARPHLNSSVVTQVNRGEILRIMDMEKKWIKIYPPAGATGWVKSEYLKEYEQKPVSDTPTDTAEKEVAVEEEQESEEIGAQESSRDQLSIVQNQIFRGKITDVGRILGRKSRYKLETEEGMYYLKGSEDMILQYLGREVIIEGEKVDRDLIYIHNIIDADN